MAQHTLAIDFALSIYDIESYGLFRIVKWLKIANLDFLGRHNRLSFPWAANGWSNYTKITGAPFKWTSSTFWVAVIFLSYVSLSIFDISNSKNVETPTSRTAIPLEISFFFSIQMFLMWKMCLNLWLRIWNITCSAF